MECVSLTIYTVVMAMRYDKSASTRLTQSSHPILLLYIDKSMSAPYSSALRYYPHSGISHSDWTPRNTLQPIQTPAPRLVHFHLTPVVL
jgi:hypothetical protein